MSDITLEKLKLIEEWEQYLVSLKKESDLSKKQIKEVIDWWETAKEKLGERALPPQVAKVKKLPSSNSSYIVFGWFTNTKTFRIEFMPNFIYCNYQNHKTSASSFFRYKENNCKSWHKLEKVLNS